MLGCQELGYIISIITQPYFENNPVFLMFASSTVYACSVNPQHSLFVWKQKKFSYHADSKYEHFSYKHLIYIYGKLVKQ